MRERVMEDRKRDQWQSRVDRLIDEAIERGDFDLSRVKGKKLTGGHIEDFAGDTAMAHKVLKNSGYAPPFLMKKREIEEALEKERARLARYALRRQRLLEEAGRAADEAYAAALRERAEADWQWAVRQFEKVIPELNKEIELFNLMNQIPSMHKMKLRMEWELERAEREIRGEGRGTEGGTQRRD
jgi:hypothetical protein